MQISGWGRYPVHEACISAPRDEQTLIKLIHDGYAIARGNGRAYGDSAVSQMNTIHMRFFNRMLEFDPTSGILQAEAGVLLSDVIAAFLPSGWFPAVTPGTKFVTLGGMVAADVHGKNHHKEGSFGRYVEWIDVVDALGAVQRCSSTDNVDMFAWTLGGMGLTGVILRVAIRLKPVQTAWIRQQTVPTKNLRHTMELFESTLDSTYSVAWIDCMRTRKQTGRSLIFLGEHAKLCDLNVDQQKFPFAIKQKKRKTIPIDLPSWTLNRFTLKAFNALYYRNGLKKQGNNLVDWDSFFYPLDSIFGWNRIYGRKGFIQFQCVIPLTSAEAGIIALLSEISSAGIGSFLAVLKRLGQQESYFSFPMEGYTLALDFPACNQSFNLIEKLDNITIEHGGRFYLAKDACLSADTFRLADTRAVDFATFRSEQNFHNSFQSLQSQRLSL